MKDAEISIRPVTKDNLETPREGLWKKNAETWKGFLEEQLSRKRDIHGRGTRECGCQRLISVHGI